MKRRRNIRHDFDPIRDWDGRALITCPWLGVVNADAYKRNYCEVVMAEHDHLPPPYRELSRQGLEIPEPPEMSR